MNAQHSPTSTRRAAVAATAALAGFLIAIVITVVTALSDPDPESTLGAFLSAWRDGDYATAAAATDGPPDQVAAALEANVDGLDGASLDGQVEAISTEGEEARAAVAMTWDVPEFGEFAYTNQRVGLVLADGEWRLAWSPRVVHPQLRPGERLGTETSVPDRAPILDREGRELVSMSPAVEVGVIPAELEDRAAAADAIAAATGADAKALKASIRAAEPENFVPAITMRLDDVEPVRAELEAIPGVELGERELPLAPTREFARQVLGAVGPVTAEQIEEDPELDVGQQVGQSALQAAFEEQLAGTPDRAIVIRNAKGRAVKELREVEGKGGEPLETTLDLRVQRAAEAALGGVEGNAALIVLDPASGDILAAANRPVEDGFNRAMAGQYPPGSTFKVVTTKALLETGLDPDETVECPSTFDVGGREFVNFEGSAAGAVPFATDFAQSCNTAFVSLADRLEPGDLRAAGRLLGLGADYDLALDAFSGRVPPGGNDEVEDAAAMIGQGRVLASPLAMAGVAAAVQNGAWHQPRLLASDRSEAGETLDTEQAQTLRELMRSVVTSGTGVALYAAPGEPIGKSGTAEHGEGDPPPTHAWFIAARDGIAVAVIVEGGTSGGEVAAPIVADFLTRLG